MCVCGRGCRKIYELKCSIFFYVCATFFFEGKRVATVRGGHVATMISMYKISIWYALLYCRSTRVCLSSRSIYIKSWILCTPFTFYRLLHLSVGLL